MTQFIPLSNLSLGAVPDGAGGCAFRVWAPERQAVEVRLLGPAERGVLLAREDGGYHAAAVGDVPPGTDYLFRLDGETDRPDPASRWQPHGVHGPSRVTDPRFDWTDSDWRGLPLRDYVLYELHVGTFTSEGTFAAVQAHLPALRDLGVTAIELMPVAQFPGRRNWGYDGVYPFAAQDSYGGPIGLKRLVNAAHLHGLAVVLDVVYNHVGPEGNCLADFAPYFTDRYRTPWGKALNFDGPHSDHVRRYFIENALYWQQECHIDALRLDAVHAIHDFSAVPFLEELGEACHAAAAPDKGHFLLIAESDLNMARHILPRRLGGYGLDAQWSDDFHHALHVLLTGEQQGYYSDYGGLSQFAKVWREGYAYTGEHSRHRQRRHGSSPRLNLPEQFVVFAQNHDQVGNRRLGDRLSSTLSAARQRLAAAAVLLSPFVPLLFMGEEYGETAPFQYFVSHTDPALVEAVRRGRREEFAAFDWAGDVSDPQDPDTFRRSTLNHALAEQADHRSLRAFYRDLLALRKGIPAIALVAKENIETTAFDSDNVLMIRQWTDDDEVVFLFNFSDIESAPDVPLPPGRWRKRLDSSDARRGGLDSPDDAVRSSAGHMRLELPAGSLLLYQRLPNA